MPALEQYFVLSGGRRFIASREAGRTEISAKITKQGSPDIHMQLRLDQHHSPKAQVARDSRYIIYSEYPIAVMGQEAPPIEVELLGSPGQPKSTPLTQVVLN